MRLHSLLSNAGTGVWRATNLCRTHGLSTNRGGGREAVSGTIPILSRLYSQSNVSSPLTDKEVRYADKGLAPSESETSSIRNEPASKEAPAEQFQSQLKLWADEITTGPEPSEKVKNLFFTAMALAFSNYTAAQALQHETVVRVKGVRELGRDVAAAIVYSGDWQTLEVGRIYLLLNKLGATTEPEVRQGVLKEIRSIAYQMDRWAKRCISYED